jgi:hypothetical protein
MGDNEHPRTTILAVRVCQLRSSYTDAFDGAVRPIVQGGCVTLISIFTIVPEPRPFTPISIPPLLHIIMKLYAKELMDPDTRHLAIDVLHSFGHGT